MEKVKISIYNIVLFIAIAVMIGFFIGYSISDTSHTKVRDDLIMKDLTDIQLQLDDIRYNLDNKEINKEA